MHAKNFLWDKRRFSRNINSIYVWTMEIDFFSGVIINVQFFNLTILYFIVLPRILFTKARKKYFPKALVRSNNDSLSWVLLTYISHKILSSVDKIVHSFPSATLVIWMRIRFFGFFFRYLAIRRKSYKFSTIPFTYSLIHDYFFSQMLGKRSNRLNSSRMRRCYDNINRFIFQNLH